MRTRGLVAALAAIAMIAAAPIGRAQSGTVFDARDAVVIDEADDVPACHPKPGQNQDWAACLAAAPQASPLWRLAAMNLGSQAVGMAQFSEAVRFYDLAATGGVRVDGDINFHAMRAYAFGKVGRDQEAAKDAIFVWSVLNRDPSLEPALIMMMMSVPIDEVDTLSWILPALKRMAAPQFQAALARYVAAPDMDWVSSVNKAGTLGELGDWSSALVAVERAAVEQPGLPAVLNTRCYTLANLDRAEEALPYCKLTVALAPSIGASRHSYAFALAKLGQCENAKAQMAIAKQHDPNLQATIECEAS